MIAFPSIIEGLDAAIYHAHPAISNSYLSRLKKCPAAAKVEQETTDAMRFGSALHAYALEGETAFFAQYVVMPAEAPKRPTQRQIEAKKPSAETVAAIEFWAKFDRENADRQPVSQEDFQTILAMSAAVHAHPFAAKILEAGRPELSAFWVDDLTGEQMKLRTDWLTTVGVAADLKSTDDASEIGFTRSVTKYGYHRQAALYLDGLNAAGESVDAFAFIAVEKKAPYRVEVYTLSQDFLEAGRLEYRSLLNLELECRATAYPAYQNPGVTELQKPAYL